MAAIVVPFRGTGGKSRLRELSQDERERLVLAMLADVLTVATALSRTVVVTSDERGAGIAREAGAEIVADPGGGQGAAVAAALGLLPADPVLVLNADVPCATQYDLLSLLAATPPGGIALVPSADGRTNVLSLPAPDLFQPLYGPRSAERFREAAAELGLEAVALAIPNLADDVDTEDDLERIAGRAGPRTSAVLAETHVHA
jgi:2-phospho-L-lactate/phosphoenolpyruvate guanylyltransferase